MSRPNFLKLSKKRKAAIIAYGTRRHWRWIDLAKHYRQPTWCNYHEALSGMMGCWSLVGMGGETKDLYKRRCNTCDLSDYFTPSAGDRKEG